MSNYKYAYEKLMEEYDLELKDLPEDARAGVSSIANIEKAIKMAEKKGKKVSNDTISKIKANDKWICNEILDMVENTDENEDDIPYDQNELIEGVQEVEDDKNKSIGVAVDGELEQMFKTGKFSWKPNELKVFKTTYNVLFDSYEDDGENGVETSNYKLIETENETFTLSKK